MRFLTLVRGKTEPTVAPVQDPFAALAAQARLVPTARLPSAGNRPWSDNFLVRRTALALLGCDLARLLRAPNLDLAQLTLALEKALKAHPHDAATLLAKLSPILPDHDESRTSELGELLARPLRHLATAHRLVIRSWVAQHAIQPRLQVGDSVLFAIEEGLFQEQFLRGTITAIDREEGCYEVSWRDARQAERRLVLAYEKVEGCQAQNGPATIAGDVEEEEWDLDAETIQAAL